MAKKDADYFLEFFGKRFCPPRARECLCLLCVRRDGCRLKQQCQDGSRFARRDPNFLDAVARASEIAEANGAF